MKMVPILVGKIVFVCVWKRETLRCTLSPPPPIALSPPCCSTAGHSTLPSCHWGSPWPSVLAEADDWLNPCWMRALPTSELHHEPANALGVRQSHSYIDGRLENGKNRVLTRGRWEPKSNKHEGEFKSEYQTPLGKGNEACTWNMHSTSVCTFQAGRIQGFLTGFLKITPPPHPRVVSSWTSVFAVSSATAVLGRALWQSHFRPWLSHSIFWYIVIIILATSLSRTASTEGGNDIAIIAGSQDFLSLTLSPVSVTGGLQGGIRGAYGGEM